MKFSAAIACLIVGAAFFAGARRHTRRSRMNMAVAGVVAVVLGAISGLAGLAENLS